MAIAVRFSPASLTRAQYDDTIQRLTAQTGSEQVAGRSYHALYGQEPKLQVLEIWDSPEAFQAFGPVLMPILAQVGIDPGQPEVLPIHNAIVG